MSSEAEKHVYSAGFRAVQLGRVDVSVVLPRCCVDRFLCLFLDVDASVPVLPDEVRHES